MVPYQTQRCFAELPANGFRLIHWVCFFFLFWVFFYCPVQKRRLSSLLLETLHPVLLSRPNTLSYLQSVVLHEPHREQAISIP